MNAILERVGHERVAVLPHDAYYRDLTHLSREERAQVNFDHPDAFDNALYMAHLDALTNGQQVAMPTYDFANYVRLPEVLNVLPQPVVLLEGILIFADAELRARMGIKIFVDAENDLRIIRRIQRDTHSRGRTVLRYCSITESTVRPRLWVSR